jgi:uncharacterized membrane protein
MDDYTSPIMIAIYAIIAILGIAVFVGVVLPQIPTRSIGRMFLGVQAPPIFVAFLRRGVVTALATLVITRIAVALGVDGGLDIAGVAGTVWGLVELAWGMLDQTKKANQNAINPPPVAGSGGN